MNTFPAVIQQTVRDFRAEYSEWESDVQDLFRDMDQFLLAEGHPDTTEVSQTVAADVAGLKGLVEQQTEVLSALVNALTGSADIDEPPSDIEQVAPDNSQEEVDPFERLQQAVAAAAESN